MQKANKYTKANDYQLFRTLKSMSGVEDVVHAADIPDALRRMWLAEVLTLPFATEDVFVTYERLPVLGGVVNARNSPLVTMLLDRPDEIGFVIESRLSGKDALWFAKLINGSEEARAWLDCMPLPDLTIRPVDRELCAMVAPLKAFLRQQEPTDQSG